MHDTIRPPAIGCRHRRFDSLRHALAGAGLRLRSDETARDKLSKLRSTYEPYVHSMAKQSDADVATVAVYREGTRQLAGGTVGQVDSGAGIGSGAGQEAIAPTSGGRGSLLSSASGFRAGRAADSWLEETYRAHALDEC